MNHLNARQRVAKENGTPGNWDYTSRNDDAIWRIGYCAGWTEWSDTDRQRVGVSDEEYEKMKQHEANYHTEGHATEAEALACYKQFLIDRAEFEVGERPMSPCITCVKAPVGVARIPGEYRTFPLCAEHLNAEGLAAGLPTPGEVWVS